VKQKKTKIGLSMQCVFWGGFFAGFFRWYVPECLNLDPCVTCGRGALNDSVDD